ncbi:MAG TPA: hypothetical protein PLV12_08240, partial [Saprospiraceae bacterium]|nr:hypothetical protein [Saprospiraceae bacterium]
PKFLHFQNIFFENRISALSLRLEFYKGVYKLKIVGRKNEKNSFFSAKLFCFDLIASVLRIDGIRATCRSCKQAKMD